MAKIRREGKKEVPAISTASLPDIIFMLLFFFMATTSMKEVTYKVHPCPRSDRVTIIGKKIIGTLCVRR